MENIMWIITFLCSLVCFICCHGIENASQVHISYGQSYDRMIIMWSTQENDACYVEYNTSENNTQNETSRVSALQSDYLNANRFIHRAELKGLELETVYFYKVVCDNGTEITETPEYNFKTESNRTDKPVKFLVFGDMGAQAGQPTIDLLQKEVTSSEYNTVWHVGDLGYDLHSDDGAVGDMFLEKIEPLATHVPYMTSPGNHELRSNLHHYRTRFSMPGTDWPMPLNKLWYSYDIGPVHFISFSTEVYFTYNQNYVCQQFDWLLKDLTEANQNRHKRPWIIAMGHRPMYCSNSDNDDCTGRIFGYMVKYGLEDLFYAQGVDLVIQAHEHSYERLWPVYRNKFLAKDYMDPKAPVHIITGAAGCGEGIDQMGLPDPWSAYKSDIGSEHSFGRLQVQNATHLLFEQIRVKDVSVLDSFWLVQNNHGPNVADLNCSQAIDQRHFSCNCPPPFHFITVILFAVFSLASLTTFCAVGLFMHWRNKKLQKMSHKPSVGFFTSCCSHKKKGHSLLLDDEDLDDYENSPQVLTLS